MGSRLPGPTELDLEARQQHWQQLNPGARALWGWPEPGAPLEREAAFPSGLADGTALPSSFELVRIEVQAVELLELTGHPHQRRRWTADQHWAEEQLNP